MDNHSKEVRSFNMSRIRSKNTKPEEIVRKFLFAAGFRYRKNDKRFPGCPDIVLKKYKTALFVNGCFWHGHTGCRYFIWPKSNKEYWQRKISGNIARDKQTYASLRDSGWNVIIIWECQLKKDKRESTLTSLIEEIVQRPDTGGADIEQEKLDS
jgi:DNA mismatch endonuclease (patch repair protein)